MATTFYRNQLNSFYRQMGETEAVITPAAPDTIAGNKRWPLLLVFDYFWEAGTALREAIVAIGLDNLRKHTPSSWFRDEYALAGGVATITDYVYISDQAVAYKDPDYPPCKRIPEHLISVIPHKSSGRWTPTTDSPWFDIKRDGNDTKVYVYPTTMTKIYLTGIDLIAAPLVSSNNNFDTWNKLYPDLLVSGAVAKAKAGTGDFSLAAFFEKALLAKYPMLQKKQLNLNKVYVEKK